MVRWFKYLIGLILAAGLCLRMMGLYNGYPEIYFYDKFRFVGTASRILESGNLNPHWFGHPGGFIIYLECIMIASITAVHFMWLLVHGQVEGFAEYIKIYGKNPDFNPAVFHFAGRLMIVLFALISIYMLYKIGKKHFHPIVGLLAAAVLALAPLHIEHSQKIRTDIATTMWILVAIWFLFEYIDDAKIRNLWVAAFCGGISVATKYTSGIILFPILFVAYKLNYHGVGFKGLLEDAIRFKGAIVWVLSLFFLGFFVFSPFVVLDFGAALKDMVHEARSIHPGAESDGIISNYIWYSKGALCKGIGNIVIEVVALFGFVLLLMPASKVYACK